MVAKIDGTNGVLQQYDYQVPTTGFSYTFAAGTTVLVMNPAGTLATGTITMPAAPVDGMTISFSSTQAITALTVAGNTGQSIVGNPTTMLAGGAATFMYRLSNTTWYSQANTVQVGSAGSPAPVVTIYTSPSPWTKSPTLKGVKVTVVGGGASGAAANGNPRFGGGGGGTGIGFFPAPTIPGPVTVTVGAGGAAVAPIPGPAGTAANSGQSSSFGALITATGGSGPTGPTTTIGAGGTVTPSPVIYGQSGGAGNETFIYIDQTAPATPYGVYAGGNSGFNYGIGGQMVPTPQKTYVARGFGAGGASGTPSLFPSQAGTAGVVIVEEFY